jgi:hypothetical protein
MPRKGRPPRTPRRWPVRTAAGRWSSISRLGTGSRRPAPRVSILSTTYSSNPGLKSSVRRGRGTVSPDPETASGKIGAPRPGPAGSAAARSASPRTTTVTPSASAVPAATGSPSHPVRSSVDGEGEGVDPRDPTGATLAGVAAFHPAVKDPAGIDPGAGSTVGSGATTPSDLGAAVRAQNRLPPPLLPTRRGNSGSDGRGAGGFMAPAVGPSVHRPLHPRALPRGDVRRRGSMLVASGPRDESDWVVAWPG